MSPPYDQFDAAMITRLEARNPHNISRLIKAPDGGSPDPSGEHYRTAKALLDRWIAEKALTPDDAAGFYPYTQTYTVGSTTLTRNGFIGLGDLRDTGLFTHEQTHTHVRDDRTELRLATAADFGLIFMIYSDPAQSIDRLLRDCQSGSPLLVAEQPDGSIHRLYRCANEVFTRRMTEQMAGFDCMIADGHHRTSAAMEAWKKTGDERWAYAMMAFFNADSAGMTVLPIHRTVMRSEHWDFNDFLETLVNDFEIHDIPMSGASADEIAQHLDGLVRDQQRRDRVAFGMIGPNPDVVYLIDAPSELPEDWPWPESAHPIVRPLATAIFETGILRAALGYTDAYTAAGKGLNFPKDPVKVVESVRAGTHQLGFILPPTPLSAVLEIARQRQNLPQKSTYFFPKLLTGLLVNKIDYLPPV